MNSGGRLFRWFRNISIIKKLYFVVGIMGTLIAIELFVLVFCLQTLSSLRAYVGGEGLWSKAEKDAVFSLYQYGVSRAEADYQRFTQFMAVPIGDAEARKALLNGGRDVAAARAGFLDGRNHRDDIDGMISLFLRFDRVYYIRKAIDVWGDAQAIALQLLPIGEQLHREIAAVAPSQDEIDGLLASARALNQRVTSLEDEFSFTLGEGSRWLESVVLRLLFATAVTVEATGLLLAFSVSRGIHKGLANVIQSARSLSDGQLGARAKVVSGDELGMVAAAFNAMADKLQAQVDERERAETGLRDAVSRLELALGQLERETAERMRSEDMLRLSVKMRALGQLTGGIAHDFNNHLAVIIGCVEILQDMVKGHPEQADLAQEILDSALTGSQLTRRLLAVGRKQMLQPQTVALNEVLTNQAAMLRRVIGAGIAIEVISAPDLWLTDVDPTQVADALLNLVVNARDAMSRGGTVSLEAANAHLDANKVRAYGEMEPGDYVMLAVGDTGEGMSPSVIEQAIEPFFTTKPPAAGSGLGLAMVYGFAKQSGGHLVIESEVGVGTTVRLFLPRSAHQARSAAGEATSVADPSGIETILVVDDNVTLLGIAKRHLVALGYSVLAAGSGPAALVTLRAHPDVDLLFTDIVMPDGMSGYELTRAARRMRPDLKALFTTGYTADPSQVGPARLLQKPYNHHELAAAVRAALDEAPNEGEGFAMTQVGLTG